MSPINNLTGWYPRKLKTIGIFLFFACLHPVTLLSQSDLDIEAERLASKAWEMRENAPDSSLFYARRALEVASRVQNRKIEAYSLSDIGNYFKRQEEYDSAKYYIRASLKLRRQFLGRTDEISGMNLMALVFRQQELYDSARYYYEQGLVLCVEREHQALRAKLLDGLGLVKFHSGDFQGGVRSIDEGLQILSALGDTLGMANSWQNLGIVNQKIGNRIKAQIAYEEARKLYLLVGSRKGIIEVLVNEAGLMALDGKFVDAQNKLEAALDVSISEGYLSNLSAIYNNLATISAAQGNTDEAIRYHELDFERSILQKKELAIVEAGINLVRLNLELKRIDEIERLIHEVSQRINSETPSWIVVEFGLLKGEYYAIRGDYGKAYSLTIDALNRKNKLIELYNHTQEQEELLSSERQKGLLLEETNQRQRAELEQKNAEIITSWAIALSVLFLAIALLVIIFSYRKGQQLRIEKAEAERDASDQKNERLEKDKEISRIIKQADEKTYEAILETQESMRISIAQDLHDQVGSNLSLVQILLSNVEPGIDKLSEKIREQFFRAESILDSSCEDVRKLSRQMKMGNTGAAGLIPSLEEYFRVINQYASTKIDFGYKGQIGRLGTKAEHEISAIIKTYIDNVLRHAKATKATVSIYVGEDDITLSLNDNGIGFDLGEETLNRGSGLGNIQARAEMLNGLAEIESRPGEGTRISIKAKT